MFSAVIVLSVLAGFQTASLSDNLFWPVDDVTIRQVDADEDLYGVTVPGFSNAGEELVLLPERTVMLSVPPGEEVSVRVVPSAVRSLGAVPEIASLQRGEDGSERYISTDISSLQQSWGETVGSGTFRRAGYVSVRLHPVIVQNGELLAAGSLRIELDFENSSRPERVSGHEGEIFQSVFGTNEVWRTPLSPRAESPFWGKPWAVIQVDTAGVFAVEAELIPEAIGMPSSSFSMITGRGRTMSMDNPAEDSFVPREVPIIVDDGGDGTFDADDRVIFYGRGLSWWGSLQSDHFNSRYDELNSFWLTWGGEGGPFMEVFDGSITGAPSGGTSYTNRFHFEQNSVLSYSYNIFADLYAWHRISAISTVTANYTFSSPGTSGSGVMRINLAIEAGSRLKFTAEVNGVVAADTIMINAGLMTWDFPVTGLKSNGNLLALQIETTTSSRDAFVVYTDWIEVFPETDFKTWSTQCQVPLDRRFFPTGERRAVSWAQSLDDDSFVCLALSDTAVAVIDFPGGKDFEIDIPGDWRDPVMWVIPDGVFKEPVSVTSRSPGRIVETLSSGNTVYVYPDEYAVDMPLFERGRSDVLFVSLTEIYDEFNGGVRDPGATRAFLGHTLKEWTNPPTELVLVGTGHYDPRGFTTAKPCPVDVIPYIFEAGLPVCTDFLYSITMAGSYPEAAVSRIAVDSRTELQLVAQRSQEYSDPSAISGTWQSVVLGAADDERSPKNPSADETYHTVDVEEIMDTVVPDRFIPARHYLINYDWNSNWKKPQARQDYINTWSEGALISFFLGHGSYDQIADEGLLFIEDVALLACGPRLPYMFFGSCDVGVFQNPSHACMAQKITVAAGGGAIVSSGASCGSFGSLNANFFTLILTRLLSDPQYSIGENQWLALLENGFTTNDRKYIIFGDGSLHLALPDSGLSVDDPEMFTSELCEINGSLNREGLVMLTAWESAAVDSYFTQNHNYLIEYLSTPDVFYRGIAEASPQFTAEMFVPSIAQIGDRARVRYFSPGPGGGSLECSYPVLLSPGSASGDTTGPEIEMWISGFRGVENPSVSGDIVFEAALEDSSGINLLPYPGAQLALYIDDNPVDVSDFFTYDPGSAKSGRIVYPLPDLQPGDHQLRLRAVDNVENISWEESTFHLLNSSTPVIDKLFVHPTPASTVMSFNWTQSMDGPVSISIYTVSGRRIVSMGNLPAVTGYNQHHWNLLDDDSDVVASGTYIYVVSAGDSEIVGVATVVR